MGTKSRKATTTTKATTSSTSTAEPTSSGSAQGAPWGELQPAPTTIGALVDLEVAAAREARASDARAPRLLASIARALLEVEGRRLRGEGTPADEKALRAALKALRAVVGPVRGMVQSERGPAVSCAVLPARPDLAKERHERIRALLEVCEEAARMVKECRDPYVGPGLRSVVRLDPTPSGDWIESREEEHHEREPHPVVCLAASVVRERTFALFGVRVAKAEDKPGEWLARLAENGRADAETIARRALRLFADFTSKRADEAVDLAIKRGASTTYRKLRKAR